MYYVVLNVVQEIGRPPIYPPLGLARLNVKRRGYLKSTDQQDHRFQQYGPPPDCGLELSPLPASDTYLG